MGAFDVADLYRAAWVQAVSAFDHWIHRELYDRALGFMLNADVPRLARFLKLEIPMSLFEDVHHHAKTLREAFETYLRGQFGHQSFQAPEKVKQALGCVSDVSLWPEVAKRLSAETGQRVVSEQVQDALTDIVRRRNKIAHEADRNPHSVHDKQPISSRDTSETIDRISGSPRRLSTLSDHRLRWLARMTIRTATTASPHQWAKRQPWIGMNGRFHQPVMAPHQAPK